MTFPLVSFAGGSTEPGQAYLQEGKACETSQIDAKRRGWHSLGSAAAESSQPTYAKRADAGRSGGDHLVPAHGGPDDPEFLPVRADVFEIRLRGVGNPRVLQGKLAQYQENRSLPPTGEGGLRPGPGEKGITGCLVISGTHYWAFLAVYYRSFTILYRTMALPSSC